jgi:ABC-type Zn uptake system ZnuABC Zn-binding protein ZnuA
VKGGLLSIRQVKNVVLFALLVFSLVIHVHCEQSSTDKIKVTTTTSLLGTLVKAIGKEEIDVSTIVPAGMCPGHFDLKAENVKELSGSRILLSHGWEKWTGKLLAAVDNKPALRIIGVQGNLMVPDNHKKAAEHITSLLCSLDQQYRTVYTKNFASYTSAIDSIVKDITDRSKDIKGIKIVCSELQAEFLQWLGLDIVLTYRRAEELTPGMMAEAIKQAKREQVRLVVDNLQSGYEVGLAIAKEANVKHITLTNFPLGNSYPEALAQNFSSVVQALQ